MRWYELLPRIINGATDQFFTEFERQEMMRLEKKRRKRKIAIAVVVIMLIVGQHNDRVATLQTGIQLYEEDAMNNASRMRIICDPFKKEIEYQWYDSNTEDYVEFDPENSKLASEELVYATIQNRAYEIVNIINRECNVGNVGLEIVFIGTQDDYDDFCAVINNYYQDANIKCVRDSHFFYTASDVMPMIKQKFSEVKETLEKYTEKEIEKLICKYEDTVKPSISLCMMGLYSAGKSAFINSIIGAEVLPSASDPTTAKVCKIYCDKKYQIRFWFDNKECILTFSGNKYKPNSNLDKEIIKELQSIVETETHHDEVYHMNRALDILNNYSNDTHKISDIIEIRIPFKRTSLPVELFDFVIYDTPGSNSNNNVRHFEVLKDSLDEQTNVLPVFVTAPDTMDAEDNEKILKLIEDTGAALDTTNAIVVVNKADEKGSKSLRDKREKCQSLRITKWKSTRIFFLSSVIAIASKKANPDDKHEWLDTDMFEIYEEKRSKYSSDEKKLFEFNIVDESKTDDIVTYSNEDKTTHLYKNSGLESIEKEIKDYASKYALYNKCQQASVYLQNAIDLCVKNIVEAKDELNDVLEATMEALGTKEKKLKDSLEDKKKIIPLYNEGFQELIEKDFTVFVEQNNLQDTPEDKKKIQDKLQDQWKQFKETEKNEKKDKSWAFSKIQKFVYEMYNDYLWKFSQRVNRDIESFWSKKCEEFREECIKIVYDSDVLTEGQKRILVSLVRLKDDMPIGNIDFDLRRIGVIRKRQFFFWKLKSETFDVKSCRDKLISEFNNAVRKRMTGVILGNEKYFKNWVKELIKILEDRLCDFNPELKSYKHMKELIEDDIESKEACKEMLDKSKDYIDGLLNMQGGVDNG